MFYAKKWYNHFIHIDDMTWARRRAGAYHKRGNRCADQTLEYPAGRRRSRAACSEGAWTAAAGGSDFGWQRL
ncbi:hypothetical protein ANACOL_02907 [Anaerotruncus colihominis DSM 17241]|uniref:Uncharacterized protein n=1 Tax=Anaerotruncus colihominis DSM 17241 TaxID=445972 RepID=B0PEB8_9FIRM|nr:hypothetical protein ANACOL_02907 [Anaerotruncus colihominis DSM 17241]